MTVYDADNASFNGVEFFIQTIRPTKVPRTKKQRIGPVLVENRVLGFTTLQRRLSIQGSLTGPTSDSARVALEATDDGQVHVYIDGHNDGNYVITRGGLSFSDTGQTFNIYNFTMELVEE